MRMRVVEKPQEEPILGVYKQAGFLGYLAGVEEAASDALSGSNTPLCVDA